MALGSISSLNTHVHAHTQTQINEGVECEYKVGGRRGTVRGLEFKLGKEKVQVMKGK